MKNSRLQKKNHLNLKAKFNFAENNQNNINENKNQTYHHQKYNREMKMFQIKVERI